MLRPIILTIAIIFGAQIAFAEGENPGIEAAITGQMEAFRSQDVEDAFGYASPMIQGMFGNSTRFGMMVEQGYPMVWNNVDVQFLDLQVIPNFGGRMVQRLMLRDDLGGFHMLDYMMVPFEDGWQIDGVSLVQAPDIGV
jgi:hypothetical protein